MINQTNIIALIFLGIILGLFSCAKNNKKDLLEATGGCDTTSAVSYSTDIRPILDQNCSTPNCHSTLVKAGGFNLEDFAPTKDAVLGSRFMGTINHTSGFSPMPKGGTKLSDCDINKFQRWADAGAPNN